MKSYETIASLAIDAVVDDAALRAMCEELRTAFGATHFLFVEQTGEPVRSQIIDTTFSQEAVRRYVEYYSTVDLWAREVMRRPRAGVQTSQELLPQSVYLESEGYRDFARPWINRVEHLLGVVEPTGPEQFLSLSLLRTGPEGAFDEQEKARLAQLTPLLGRLIRARATLRDIVARTGLGFRGLDALPRPIFIVDAAMRIVFANQAAQRRFKRADLRTVRSSGDHETGDLGVWLGGERDALARAVRQVAAGATPSLQLALRANAQERACIVEVLRVSDPSQYDGGFCAMLVVREPGRRVLPEPAVLVQAFGLTGAEARVAIAIAGGATMLDYASRHGISAETVRTQVKSAFSKLGVHRQAELVRLILAIAD